MCAMPFPFDDKNSSACVRREHFFFLVLAYECRELYRCVCCWFLLPLHDDGCILDYTFCFLSGALPTLCNRGRMFIVVFQYYDYNFLSFFKRTWFLFVLHTYDGWFYTRCEFFSSFWWKVLHTEIGGNVRDILCSCSITFMCVSYRNRWHNNTL